MLNELSNEFDFTSVDSILSEETTELNEPTEVKKEKPPVYDFSSVDKIVSALKTSSKKKTTVKPLPQPSAYVETGGLLHSGYGLRKAPIKGASTFHPAIDIKADYGDPVPPAGDGEVIAVGRRGGKGLSVSIKHDDERITEYNHLSKTEVEVGDRVKRAAIIGRVGSTGISTGSHLDFRVKINGRYVNPLQELDSDPKTEGIQLRLKTKLPPEVKDVSQFDFSAIDNLPEIQEQRDKLPSEDFNFDSVDKVAATEGTIPAIDPNDIKFKLGRGKQFTLLANFEKANTPRIVGANPLDVGEVISTVLDLGKGNNINSKSQKDIEKVTDAWLAAWNPKYVRLNQQFRAETGGLNIALVDSPANRDSLGNGKYQITSRPARGVQALFEAYEKGGLPAFHATNNLINKQIDLAADEFKQKKVELEEIRKRHPYISELKGAGQDILVGWVQKGMNLRNMVSALYIGNTAGYDSQEYLDATNREIEEQEGINSASQSIYEPPSIMGKIRKGIVVGALSFPEFALAGRTPVGLPLMVYIENMHRGNRNAVTAALPMALMVGGGRGISKYLNKGTTVGKNALSENSSLLQNTIYEVDRGAGNWAAFTKVPRASGKFTREDLSLFTERLVKGNSVSVKQMTPLQYNLIQRGANALLLADPQLLSSPVEHIGDIVTNIVVALTFPVGKSPKKVGFRKLSPPPFRPIEVEGTNLLTGQSYLDRPLSVDQGRADIPVTRAPKFGKLPILESERQIPPVIYPSAESPNVEKYGEVFDPTKFVGETETGFQAQGEGQTLRLDIDTANLNLLELKRVLADGSYRKEGDSMATDIANQKALKDAIDVLEAAIPEETKAFFAENEEIIRAAIRTNYDARRPTREGFAETRKLNELQASRDKIASSEEVGASSIFPRQEILPQEIAPIPDRVKGPIYKDGKLREDIGEFNGGFKKDTAENILQNFTKIVTNSNKFGLSIIPYGDIMAKKTYELGYLTGFFIEDFYHRGIEPTISLVRNRLNETLGDFGKHLKEDTLKEAFQRGLDYFESNQADPFFSKMKQDSLERLPNRFTPEQAINILSQHKDEFEWTVGLEDFLGDNTRELRSQLAWWKNNQKESYPDPRGSEQISRLTKEIEKNEQAQPTRKINKKDLIDVIQKGQVRVEVSVGDDAEYTRLIAELHSIVGEMRTKFGENYSNMGDPEFASLRNRELALNEQLADTEKTKYSLKAYTHEKLELPGAKDSVEVKLISVTEPSDFTQTKQELTNINKEMQARKDDGLSYDDLLHEWRAILERQRSLSNAGQTQPNVEKYKSPHWDLANVVAHYRANFRTTIDNIRTYFSEEFQSDWNQEGHKRGFMDRLKGEQRFVVKEFNSNHELFQESYFATRKEAEIYKSESSSSDVFISETNARYDPVSSMKLEPNPFMSHSWKELVMKRFIRDAVVAKDSEYPYRVEQIEALDKSIPPRFFIRNAQNEIASRIIDSKNWHTYFNSKQEAEQFIIDNKMNQPYKHDGIGWTTARQQMERYGKILEGKDFEWTRYTTNDPAKKDQKLYTFKLGTRGEPFDLVTWQSPHELQGITLERFAELTTKEAANFVREQEKSRGLWTQRDIRRLRTLDKIFDDPSRRDAYWARELMEERFQLINKKTASELPPTQGKFNLAEAILIRKEGSEKYADYDVALVNIAKKIGKRFGAKYSMKEIETPDGEAIVSGDSDNFKVETGNRKQKIHFLEITPSMRRSLEKEGQSLYGLGGNEPVKTQELGTRNSIVTRVAFDEHRNTLVKELSDFSKAESEFSRLKDARNRAQLTLKIDPKNQGSLEMLRDTEANYDNYLKKYGREGTVFNSGLSPDAFIDQAKLLYKGIKEFSEFSKQLISRFGEAIEPFLQDLWFQVKDLGKKFNEPNLLDRTNAVGPTFTMNGFILARNKSQALKAHELSKRREFPLRLVPPKFHRSISLAQLNPEFGEVYNILRSGQRVRNYFSSNVLNELRAANDFAHKGGADEVADAIFNGNQLGIVYSATDLQQGRNFTQDQVDAYLQIRKAEDLNLDFRMGTKLYSLQERVNRLNTKLASVTPNTPAYDSIQNQILDLADMMGKIQTHYQQLKATGYISLQRQGKFAAFAENPAFPIDDYRRKLYNHFDSKRAANNWLRTQEANGMVNTKFSEVTKAEHVREVSGDLTPGQFEDLIDNAGVNPNDPAIEALRDEIYSRYSASGYELKREFTPGYD